MSRFTVSSTRAAVASSSQAGIGAIFMKLSLLGRCPRTNALKQIECFLDFALACLVAVKSCLSEVLKIPPLLSQALFPQAHEISGQALRPGLGAAGTFACIC